MMTENKPLENLGSHTVRQLKKNVVCHLVVSLEGPIKTEDENVLCQ